MTGGAARAGMGTGQGEGGVRECCSPVTGGVALDAIGAELPGMHSRFGVTINAGCGKALINTAGMAGCTTCIDVGSGQGKQGCGMIKSGRGPVVG
jgi:hypothetical protein